MSIVVSIECPSSVHRVPLRHRRTVMCEAFCSWNDDDGDGSIRVASKIDPPGNKLNFLFACSLLTPPFTRNVGPMLQGVYGYSWWKQSRYSFPSLPFPTFSIGTNRSGQTKFARKQMSILNVGVEGGRGQQVYRDWFHQPIRFQIVFFCSLFSSHASDIVWGEGNTMRNKTKGS